MRLIFCAILLLFFISACETIEKEVFVINPKESKSSIELKINKVINDSTIELTWTKYTGSDFKEYRLIRNAEVFKNGNFTYDNSWVKIISNRDSITFVERAMPFSKRIDYSISVITNTPNSLYSRVNYERPGTYHTAIFDEALINKDTKSLYLYNMTAGSIILFNYETNKELKRKSFDSSIGYCDLGSFESNYKNELYVPTAHGWLYILDALTLETKDKIYVGGEKVTSVVAVAAKLFVSSSDRSYATIDANALKVYDRNTKRFIGRTGYWENTRLLYLEGSAIDLIGITTNLSPTDLSYYNFTASGSPVLKRKDSYHGDHPLNPYLVKSFPDGSRIITSTSGTVYTKDLKHEKNLAAPYANKYNDFAFNHNGTSIYGALQQQKRVEEIAYPSGTVTRTFTTLLFPFKIFREDDQLICVTIFTGSSGRYFFVEKINL